MKIPSQHHQRHHSRSAAGTSDRSQPRGPRNMDIVMTDSVDPSSHERNDAFPVPSRPVSEFPPYTDDGGVPVKSYGYPTTSRAASPDKSITRPSIINATYTSRSSSPEKNTPEHSNLNATYPAAGVELEEGAESGGGGDAVYVYWRRKWAEENDARRLYEGKLRSKSNELEQLQQSSFSSELFYKLQDDLAAERDLRTQAENDAHQRSNQVEEFRKRWKQVASELNKARSQSQGFYQVTDQYLTELTKQLRYNIRSFAIQHFGGEIRKKSKWERTDYWDYMELATGDTDVHDTYLLSQDKCPSIIQAFLWRFLISRIFDHFRWTNEKSSRALWTLCKVIRPKWQVENISDAERIPEVERKFQTWSATTTGLLLDSMAAGSSEAHKDMQETKDFFVDRICETINPFLRSRAGDHAHDLHQIIDDAIALDKEISRQVARVEWDFPAWRKDEVMYDPDTMELEKGEKLSKANPKVLLVVSPAMKKRGKSTGDDFKEENLLIRLEVSCEPVKGMARTKTN